MDEQLPVFKKSALVELIASVCHEANRGFCAAMGDPVSAAWDEASEHIKESARNGVLFHMEDDHQPEKTHPSLVPFENLLSYEKAKDHIFKAIVDQMCMECEFVDDEVEDSGPVPEGLNG